MSICNFRCFRGTRRAGISYSSRLRISPRARRPEAYLEFLGKHDVLTRLKNRSFYIDEINRLERKGPYPATAIAVDERPQGGQRSARSRCRRRALAACGRSVRQGGGEAVSRGVYRRGRVHCAAVRHRRDSDGEHPSTARSEQSVLFGHVAIVRDGRGHRVRRRAPRTDAATRGRRDVRRKARTITTAGKTERSVCSFMVSLIAAAGSLRRCRATAAACLADLIIAPDCSS